jgi:hypothetical protein
MSTPEQPDQPQAISEEPPAIETRKPYRAPTVQKQRSLSQATLFSGGGVGGALAGGAP